MNREAITPIKEKDINEIYNVVKKWVAVNITKERLNAVISEASQYDEDEEDRQKERVKDSISSYLPYMTDDTIIDALSIEYQGCYIEKPDINQLKVEFSFGDIIISGPIEVELNLLVKMPGCELDEEDDLEGFVTEQLGTIDTKVTKELYVKLDNIREEWHIN